MKKFIVIGILLVPFVIGCQTTEEGAIMGALGGAGAGALLGHAAGDAGKGAAIGAVAGGLLGAAAGSENERRADEGSYGAGRRFQMGPSGNEIDVTDYPPGTVVRDPYSNQTFVVQ